MLTRVQSKAGERRDTESAKFGSRARAEAELAQSLDVFGPGRDSTYSEEDGHKVWTQNCAAIEFVLFEFQVFAGHVGGAVPVLGGRCTGLLLCGPLTAPQPPRHWGRRRASGCASGTQRGPLTASWAELLCVLQTSNLRARKRLIKAGCEEDETSSSESPQKQQTSYPENHRRKTSKRSGCL